MKKLALIALACGLGLVVAVAAEEAATPRHVVVQAADLQWGPTPPSLPAGGSIAVVSGDPGAEGPFVMRLRAPNGYRVMPHFHPKAENVTVLSGIFHVGTGDTFDAGASHPIGPGGFMHMPAEAHHYAWTEGDVELQIHGTGPFTLTYVNPADDPRNAAKK